MQRGLHSMLKVSSLAHWLPASREWEEECSVFIAAYSRLDLSNNQTAVCLFPLLFLPLLCSMYDHPPGGFYPSPSSSCWLFIIVDGLWRVVGGGRVTSQWTQVRASPTLFVFLCSPLCFVSFPVDLSTIRTKRQNKKTESDSEDQIKVLNIWQFPDFSSFL